MNDNSSLFFREPSLSMTDQTPGEREQTMMGRHRQHKQQERQGRQAHQEQHTFEAYDQVMKAAVFSADLHDGYHHHQPSATHGPELGNADTALDDCASEDDASWEDDSHENDYDNGALLDLILGVHAYLNDETKYRQNQTYDSPLFELQYKMYMYMKQCAYEMGYDINVL